MKALTLCFTAVFVGAVSLHSQDAPEDWPQQRLQFLESIRAPDQKTAREAVTAASAFDHGAGAEMVIELLENRRTPLTLKEDLTSVLASYQSEPAQEVVRKTATDSSRLNRYLLAAFIEQSRAESRVFLLRLVKDAPSPRLRALAIEGVSKLGNEATSERYAVALSEWLADDEAFHGTRIAAAEALSRMQWRGSIPTLIALLDDPLLNLHARDALLRLTGESHWMDKTGWENWWEGTGGVYDPKPLDDETFAKRHEELVAAKGDGSSLASEFYGRSVVGKNLLFILDTSGSMFLADRINYLKQEMDSMVQGLSEKHSFGILTFPEQNVPGRDFGQAEEKHKERNLEFINEMTPSGQTPMIEALEYAFKRIVPRNRVDTIYLLSDGIPSDLFEGSLSDAVLELNETEAVRINTIYIATLPEGALPADDPLAELARESMKTVAEVSGGDFWAVE
ncbi:MAG: VWA domain-containing protein [Verrucomicrobiota bacterium]